MRSLWLVLLGARLAAACEIYCPEVTTGPEFTVAVADEQKQPIAGLRLRMRGSGLMITAVADANGVARFTQVPPNRYLLSAERDVLYPNCATVIVDDVSPARPRVSLLWPGHRVLSARTLTGLMQLPDGVAPRTSLTVTHAISLRQVAASPFDATGRFDFPSLPPGLYFLDWKSGSGEPARLLLGVDPQARSPRFDLDVTWSSCGHEAFDRSLCPPVHLTTARLAGFADNRDGQAMRRRALNLTSDTGQAARETTVAVDGSFDFGSVSPGRYILEMPWLGLTLLRATVHIEPSAPRKSVRLIVANLDGCSEVRQ